jgi:hypothetical protein
MKNPFLNYVLDDKNISKIFIILSLNSSPIDNRINSLEIEESIYNELMKNYILVESDINILKKKNLRISIVSINKDDLEQINLLKYQLEEVNNVIFYPYFLYNQFKIYLSIYEKKSLSDLYNILIINNHIKDKQDKTIQNYYYNFIISMCKNFDKIQCVTKNYSFNNRNFFENNNYHNDGYLSFIKNKNNHTINTTDNFTQMKEQLNLILKKLDYKNKFTLICYLLISRDYCHLVINNNNLLKEYKLIFYNNIYLFRYLLGFTWVHLYLKEMGKKKNMTKEDDFIFDINTANKLINFPNCVNCMTLNPYNSMLIHSKYLTHNIYSLQYYNISFTTFDKSSIATIDQFKFNFNIFTTSNPSKNLFHKIDFKNDNIAISGSAVCACISQFHPLMCLFNNYIDEVAIKNRYYNEYYTNADIDIMIKNDNFIEFINIVKKVYNQIKKNILHIYKSYASDDHIHLKPEKVVYYFLYEEEMIEIIENYNFQNDTHYNLKQVLENIDSENIQCIFKDSYEKTLFDYKITKENEVIDEEFKKNNPEYFELNNLPFKIRKVVKFKNYNVDKIKISLKYKITSPYLNHSLELFNVNTVDFFGVIQTFHLPCVRAYFDGDNVYMTPSCISAHLTRMNLDYKYFAGTSHPCEIINKYRMRGFGIYLNLKEQDILFNYSKNNDFWSNLYDLNSSKESFMNALHFNHKLFFPRHYNADYFYNNSPVDINKGYDNNFIGYKAIILTKNDFYEIIKDRQHINDIIEYINKKSTIIEIGHVNVAKDWIIDACI